MAQQYSYEERTLKAGGHPLAFLARVRSGPNLPKQEADLKPHELDDFGRRLAAVLNTEAQLVETLREMIDAAQAVIDAWESGDLAGAVNTLDAVADEARDLIDYPAEA